MTGMRKYFVLIAALFFLFQSEAQKNAAKTKSARPKTTITVPEKALNFIAMGDWGRNGEYNQKEVAVQMGITAKETGASFIIATGDNFYPSGVASIRDYSWIASYENMYTAHSLQTDWYVVLGNHDYKGNVQAEIDYSKISRRWHLPSRYYAKKIVIDDDTTQQLLLVCIDTSPFITQYYSSADHKDEIIGQDTAAQKKWLETVLSDPSPDIKWKIVAGHHPLYTGGKRMKSPDTYQLNASLKPVFDKYKVDAYICGHDHNLQYIKPDGATHYFISGAGSETTPCVVYPGIGKFAQSINGFMVFSLTAKDMLVQAVDLKGNLLYKQAIKK
jgi:tartrate-resistant acid phosphatase type 5